MYLDHIDDFTVQILLGVHLLILAFALVYISGRFFSEFINEVMLLRGIWNDEKEEKKKLKKR